MKEILFEHMIWQAVALQHAADYVLCIMIRKGHSANDHTEEESWFWCIYNEETKETIWFMDFHKAKKAFLKICETLLKQPTTKDLPW